MAARELRAARAKKTAGFRTAPYGPDRSIQIRRGRSGERLPRHRQTRLLAEGREAWILPILQRERIVDNARKIWIVFFRGTLQPLEHVVRLLADGVQIRDQIRFRSTVLRDVIAQYGFCLGAVGANLLRHDLYPRRKHRVRLLYGVAFRAG